MFLSFFFTHNRITDTHKAVLTVRAQPLSRSRLALTQTVSPGERSVRKALHARGPWVGPSGRPSIQDELLSSLQLSFLDEY